MLLSGMAGPNGVAYDRKNNKLFVSELNLNRIHAYDIAKVGDTYTRENVVDIVPNFSPGPDEAGP